MQPPSSSPPSGVTVLVLGILSLVLCAILGPIAWIMGNEAMAWFERHGDPASERSLASAGRICGIISTALAGCGILLALLVLATASGRPRREEPDIRSIMQSFEDAQRQKEDAKKNAPRKDPPKEDKGKTPSPP